MLQHVKKVARLDGNLSMIIMGNLSSRPSIPGRLRLIELKIFSVHNLKVLSLNAAWDYSNFGQSFFIPTCSP